MFPLWTGRKSQRSQETHVEYRSVTWPLRGGIVGNHGNSPAGSQSAYGCCCLTASGANKCAGGNKKDDKGQGVVVVGKTCRLDKEQETNLRTKQKALCYNNSKNKHAKQGAGCLGCNTSVSDSLKNQHKYFKVYLFFPVELKCYRQKILVVLFILINGRCADKDVSDGWEDKKQD